MELRHAIETPLAEPFEVGAGTSLILEGWAFCPQADVRQLWVQLEGSRNGHAGTNGADDTARRFAVSQRGNARQDVLVAHHNNDARHDIRALRSGFWTTLAIGPSAHARTLQLRLVAELANGESLISRPHFLNLLPTSGHASSRKLATELPTEPRVAVCMTTYNPAEDVLRRQIDSIRNQTYSNWICLIQDDWSSRAHIEIIRRVIGDDPRFVLELNEKNLGFYLNFQRVLGRVSGAGARREGLPPFDLVCLADQDDDWYPHKLSSLISQFDAPDVTMAYSDMRIVDAQGKVLSDTFWSTRKNNYTDIETLFFANTITGAATMFKAALLPLLLPFPPKRGHIYHDWWLGLVALAAGTIRYVDEPLYDYYQHGANAVGWSHIGKIVSIKQFLQSDPYRRELAHIARGMYNYDCKFLAATIDMLRLRVPDSRHDLPLRRLAHLPQKPIRTLIGQSARAVAFKRASQNREKNVLMAHAVMRMLNSYFQRKHRELSAKFASAEEAAAAEPGSRAAGGRQVMPVDTFERKCRPLTLDVQATAPMRVNMFLATIDFKYFFGGYIGMFRLAKHIAKAGFKVRFVIIEQCDFQPALWRQKIQKYAGLEDIFDLVEVEYRFDRTIPLTCAPDDRFIATSCWSAWLAHSAAGQVYRGASQNTNGDSSRAKPFIFMIQEYEPYFVPHGSYYALSHNAYDLPQFALFSTEILREFFRQNRYGVYRGSVAEGDAKSVSFQNAVLHFNVSPERLQKRQARRKFLFYCRPEAHAQRNMFEMGVLALRQAIEKGHFDPRDWEFYGIGTVGEQFVIPLPKSAEMTALPKMSLEEYADYLPDFDVGMSLMYTPHPSLVPLEMAAAGLITITNSFANKTADVLRGVSSNFEVGDPTVDDLAAALIRAEGRVEDVAARVAGAKINWPTNWDDAFSPQVLTPLLAQLRG